MVQKTKGQWGTLREYDNGLSFTLPSAKKAVLDIGLKTAGMAVCYGLGSLVGEAMENTSYLNEWVPQSVDYLLGIDVAGNLKNFTALLGGVVGLTYSGTETMDDEPSRLKKIKLSPLVVSLRRPNGN